MALPVSDFIDNYVKNASSGMREDLQEIIDIMTLIAPDAELSFDLGIPYFQQESNWLFGVAIRKDHLCVYFSDPTHFHSFAERLITPNLGRTVSVFIA